MSSVDLSTHPVTPTSFGRWQPLNAPLGVTAFGISANICDPDEPFSIDHDESETNQQEVYIVISGQARFTIGEETVDAAAREIVAVTDPWLGGARARHPDRLRGGRTRRRGNVLRPVDHRRRNRRRRPRALTARI